MTADTARANDLLREVLGSSIHFEGVRSEPWRGNDVPRGVYRYQARRLRQDLVERIREHLALIDGLEGEK